MDNEPLVVSVLPQKEPVAVPERANKSASKSILQKSAQSTPAEDCSQQKESKTSQEVQAGDKGELQPVAGNEIIAQTKAQVSKATIEAHVNIHKEVPKKEEHSSTSKDRVIKSSGFMDDKPMESPLKNSGITKVQISEKIAHTSEARASLPQRITSDENLVSRISPTDRPPMSKPKQRTESTPTISVETQKGSVSPHPNESTSQTVKINSHSPRLSPRSAPEKPTQLPLTNSHVLDSSTPERDSRILLTQRQSPVFEGFPARVPTPDSRRSHTPDFRTPTASDISDGYGSTTSDEYYECSESPFREPKDPAVPFYCLNATEDRAIHVANSSGSNEEQATSLSLERTLSSCETLNLSTKGSLSSILEKLDDEEKLANESTHEETNTSKHEEKLTIVEPHEEELTKKSTHEEKFTRENTLEEDLTNSDVREEKLTIVNPQEESAASKTRQEEKSTNESTDVKRSTNETEKKSLNENTLEESFKNKTTHKQKTQIEIPPNEVHKANASLDLRAVHDAPCGLKSSKAISPSAVTEQSLTLRPNNETTEAKRMLARELKPKRVHSKAERPTGRGEPAFGAGGAERRDNVPTASTEGHKFSVPPTPVV